jgi:GNAT acetyltransferase-like protein
MVTDELNTRMRLVAAGAASREKWGAVVATDPGIRVQQTPIWADCIGQCDGLEDATRAYESADGRIIVVPLVRNRRLPRQLKAESSWPGSWGTCGLLTTDRHTLASDVIEIITDLRARNVLRTSIPVPWQTANQMWEAHVPPNIVREPYQTHVLDLSGGFETVWRTRFSSVVRSAARKAERLGISVQSDTTGQLLPVFNMLYRGSVDRWARAKGDPLPIARLAARKHEPYRKFEIVANLLGDACEVHVATLDGKPVAGIIVLTRGAVASYWRGAMDKQLIAGTGANELLHRVAVEKACDRGCLEYDMQRSPSAGVARFKSKFGAQPRGFLEYRFEKGPVTAIERRARGFARRVLGRPTG